MARVRSIDRSAFSSAESDLLRARGLCRRVAFEDETSIKSAVVSELESRSMDKLYIAKTTKLKCVSFSNFDPCIRGFVR